MDIPISLAHSHMYKDSEVNILKLIEEAPGTVTQRDLARAADLSLGMTNAVIKKLAARSLLVIKRINSRNIRYILTPQGMAEIARRSEALLNRTLSNVSQYRIAVELLVIQLQSEGKGGIELRSESDLDFIVEWACMKHGLSFNPGARDSDIITFSQEELLLSLKNHI